MRYNVYDANNKLVGQNYQDDKGNWRHKWVSTNHDGFDRFSCPFKCQGVNSDGWTEELVDE